jgi:CII-binding regulator of phage lambda lysogenization HflD
LPVFLLHQGTDEEQAFLALPHARKQAMAAAAPSTFSSADPAAIHTFLHNAIRRQCRQFERAVAGDTMNLNKGMTLLNIALTVPIIVVGYIAVDHCNMQSQKSALRTEHMEKQLRNLDPLAVNIEQKTTTIAEQLKSIDQQTRQLILLLVRNKASGPFGTSMGDPKEKFEGLNLLHME